MKVPYRQQQLFVRHGNSGDGLDDGSEQFKFSDGSGTRSFIWDWDISFLHLLQLFLPVTVFPMISLWLTSSSAGFVWCFLIGYACLSVFVRGETDRCFPVECWDWFPAHESVTEWFGVSEIIDRCSRMVVGRRAIGFCLVFGRILGLGPTGVDHGESTSLIHLSILQYIQADCG